MHTHILGICGTFMGGLAVLATELKHRVTGSDQNVYPPMSTQLEALGVELIQGYDDEQLKLNPDSIVVGNVMRREMPVIETLLNQKREFISGPAWLARYVLQNKTVIAVSGTHGKTTTSSMVAWILDQAGLKPGFLIGGVPQNFGISARLGEGQYFIVEADEYDSAFFDKRSKFVHYRPDVLIINNIEFDHADIFDNIAAIQTQFHHLIRTVPGQGLIIAPKYDQNVTETLSKGVWTPVEYILRENSGAEGTTGWWAKSLAEDYHQFEVYWGKDLIGTIQWTLLGYHNLCNALAAIAAARKVGVSPEKAIQALNSFKGVKRRLELKAKVKGISLFDDFAHHPTAIATTLQGLRSSVGKTTRIVVAFEIRSNSMRLGSHQEDLRQAFDQADLVYLFKGKGIEWEVDTLFKSIQKPGGVYTEVDLLSQELAKQATSGDQLVFMSNGGFGGIIGLLQTRLE